MSKIRGFLRRRRVVPMWIGMVAISAFDPILASSQGTVERYRRAWAREAHGEEVLFRPADVVVTRDCQVWVSDAGNARVYRWGCDGRPLPAIGRKGEGPGEFQVPSALQRFRGDTVAVWDHPLGRLSYFGADGRPLGSRRLQLSGAQHGFVRSIGPAYPELLVATDVYPGMTPRPDDGFTVLRGLDPEGRVSRTLARVRGPQSVLDRAAGGSVRIDAPFTPASTVLFSPNGLALIGSAGPGRLARYRYGARLVPQGQLDLGIPARRVTRAERNAWLDSMRAVLAADLERTGLDAAAKRSFAARHRRLLEGVTFPATHPRYLLAALDPADRLWVLVNEPGRRAGSRWRVYDARTGALQRQVEVPTTGRVRAAAPGPDGLYLVEVDGDGVARVIRYSR